jgi:hypothetical protein
MEKEKDDAEEGDSNKEIKKGNKQLKQIFFVMGVCILLFVGVFMFLNSVRHFKYQGVDFEIVKEGELILYQTSLPVNSQSKLTTNAAAVFGNYNFYLRNDPRRLKNIPLNIEGELSLMRNTVINFTGDFNCNGDGIIAVANVVNVLKVLDVTAIKDESAGCDPEGTYTFLQLQLGDETSIEQVGPSCYNLNINNCEVLEVTERYIVELLSEITKNKL